MIVQDIVVRKQSTTYKEVANIILNDTMNNGSLRLYTKGEIAKEEQNIKRRVYDALNVLISAGILLKEGKRVKKNDINKKIMINSKQICIKSMRSTIVNKKEIIDLKMSKLNKMKNELNCVKRLIERNKKNPGPKFLTFPFILVKPSNLPNTTFDIKKQTDSLKFAMYSNREMNLYGDLEITAMLGHSLPSL